jgi:hypothetical protein
MLKNDYPDLYKYRGNNDQRRVIRKALSDAKSVLVGQNPIAD